VRAGPLPENTGWAQQGACGPAWMSPPPPSFLCRIHRW
jgi:hypothetical protein